MITKKDFIKTINVNKANLEYIIETGIINGTLLVEIERAMQEYVDQERQQEKEQWIAKVKGMIEEIEIKIKNDNLIYPPDKGLTISERFELTGAKKKLSKLLEK